MLDTKMTTWIDEVQSRDIWDRPDFDREEYETRHARVRTEMAARGIDMLVCIDPRSLHYLIGYRGKSYQEFQCIFFPLEPGPITMLVRKAEVAEMTDISLADDIRGWSGQEPQDPLDLFAQIVSEKGMLSASTGIEVPFYYLWSKDWERIKDIFGNARLQEATTLIEDLKLVKSPAELTMIRRSAEIADLAMEAAHFSIAEGISEFEVAAATYAALLKNGSDAPASPVNFVSGPRTCYGHGQPTERKITRGDFMHIEYGGAYHRYTATIGRNFCLGAPTQRQQHLHDVQLAACDALAAAVKPGVSSEIPHLEAKRVISEAGFEASRIHTSGYGVAPAFPPYWGESIHFMSGYPYTPRILEPGMVLSIEPPIMLHEEKLGARVIDNILVTDTGGEILSRYTRDLIVID